jgi:hypothetical protein
MAYIENNVNFGNRYYYCREHDRYHRSYADDMFDTDPWYRRNIHIHSGSGGYQHVSVNSHIHNNYDNYDPHPRPHIRSIYSSEEHALERLPTVRKIKVTDRTSNRRSTSRNALYEIEVPVDYPAYEILKDLLTDPLRYKVMMLNTHNNLEELTPNMPGIDYIPFANNLFIHDRIPEPPQWPETMVVRPLERRVHL